MSVGALGAFQLASDLIGNMFNWGMNQATNQTNKAIADENRQMQADWNQIQFDYNKELQQQIFDREDTAISRQAADMARAGINPISQNLSGAGAGSPIPANLPAPQNSFQAQAPQFQLSSIADAINAFDEVESRQFQRDLMTSQDNYQKLLNQEQAIKNLVFADKNNIAFDNDGMPYLKSSFTKKEQDFNAVEFKDKNASAERNERENKFQKDMDLSDGTPSVIRSPAEVGRQLRTATQDDSIMGKASDKGPLGLPITAPVESIKKSLATAGEAVTSGLESTAKQIKEGAKKAKKKGSEVWNESKEKYYNARKWVENQILNFNQ